MKKFLLLFSSLLPFVAGRFAFAAEPMKLYYAPGVGSAAVRVLLTQLGVSAEFDKLDMATKKTQDGRDFLAINPLGYVPTLTVGNKVLTENPAILQYIADLHGYGAVIPKVGSYDRYEMLSVMNFISTEIHTAGIHAILSKSAKMPADAMPILKERLVKNLGILNNMLGKKDFFVGKKMSVLDIYAFVELHEIKAFMKVDLSDYANLNRFLNQMAKQPCVVKAYAAEGVQLAV